MWPTCRQSPTESAPGLPFFPHVSIGWDTNPRFKAPKADYISGATPELFGEYLRRALDFADARGITVALARADNDLIEDLDKLAIKKRIAPEHYYGNLADAVAAFRADKAPAS